MLLEGVLLYLVILTFFCVSVACFVIPVKFVLFSKANLPRSFVLHQLKKVQISQKLKQNIFKKKSQAVQYILFWFRNIMISCS